MNLADLALLVARLWMGWVMILHGVNHARNFESTTDWFVTIGFKRASLQARLSAIGEIAIGLGLAAGFVTSFAAAGLVVVMSVAFWTVHRFAGFFVFKRPDEGYEYVATLAIFAAVLSIFGPGQFSIDAATGLAGDLDGTVGLLVCLGGLLAGALQVAATWRPPVKT